MSPQCQRLFQIPSPINCLKLHPNQVELFIGDQSGNIHMWDLRTDYNEILAVISCSNDYCKLLIFVISCFHSQSIFK